MTYVSFYPLFVFFLKWHMKILPWRPKGRSWGRWETGASTKQRQRGVFSRLLPATVVSSSPQFPAAPRSGSLRMTIENTAQFQGSTNINSRPLGNLRFSFPCPVLFWTSSEFDQQFNTQRKLPGMLAHWVSDCWNLLARQETPLAPDYRTQLLSSSEHIEISNSITC